MDPSEPVATSMQWLKVVAGYSLHPLANFLNHCYIVPFLNSILPLPIVAGCQGTLPMAGWTLWGYRWPQPWGVNIITDYSLEGAASNLFAIHLSHQFILTHCLRSKGDTVWFSICWSNWCCNNRVRVNQWPQLSLYSSTNWLDLNWTRTPTLVVLGTVTRRIGRSLWAVRVLDCQIIHSFVLG